MFISRHICTFILHSIVLKETGNSILDMKNSKTRKRGLMVFTMTGTAAKPTEETLHQVRHVQDMVTCLKKDDCSVRENSNGNSQTSDPFSG